MNNSEELNESLILEDFDIKGLSNISQNYEIGVRVNVIYSQIAKYSDNPSRTEELQILVIALEKAVDGKRRRNKYTTMRLKDVMKCFGKSLRLLPKDTFIQTSPIESIILDR